MPRKVLVSTEFHCIPLECQWFSLPTDNNGHQTRSQVGGHVRPKREERCCYKSFTSSNHPTIESPISSSAESLNTVPIFKKHICIYAYIANLKKQVVAKTARGESPPAAGRYSGKWSNGRKSGTNWITDAQITFITHSEKSVQISREPCIRFTEKSSKIDFCWGGEGCQLNKGKKLVGVAKCSRKIRYKIVALCGSHIILASPNSSLILLAVCWALASVHWWKPQSSLSTHLPHRATQFLAESMLNGFGLN